MATTALIILSSIPAALVAGVFIFFAILACRESKTEEKQPLIDVEQV